MTVPQTTPLMLLSEYVLETNTNAGTLTGLDATIVARLRSGIIKASDFIQRMAHRRFDERIETRKFTALDERVGGALLSPYILQLDDDLKSATSVINGDGIALTQYKLIHWNQDVGVQAYSRIQLNVFSGVLWRSGGSDPWESIQVTGQWGYGGQWIDSAATVMLDSGTTVTVNDGTKLEVGMMCRIDSEYRYVDAVTTNTVTFVPAMNGSAQVTHDPGKKIYYWQALDSVRDLCRRLVQWKGEQIKTPLAGQVTIGDFTFPVNVDGLPKDLYLSLAHLSLSRTEETRGV